MTTFNVEYRGYPVPESYLVATMFGGQLSAWKRGVDDVLNAVPETEDKTEYFTGKLVSSLFYRISENGNVSSYDGVECLFFDDAHTAESIRAHKTPTTRDNVPAEFRLGGDK